MPTSARSGTNEPSETEVHAPPSKTCGVATEPPAGKLARGSDAVGEPYRRLAASMPQIVWIAMSDRRLVYCNARWAEYCGLTESSAVSAGWEPFVHAEDMASLLPRWSSAVGAGVALETEMRLLRGADAQYRWHAASFAPVRSTAGRIEAWFITCSDVHDRKEVEEALRRSRDELEASNGELRAFSYSVAHDLRTPLRGIEGMSRALLQDYAGVVPPDAGQYLERISSAAVRMGRLIEGLLQLTRLSRAECRSVNVDLSEIASAAAAEMPAGDRSVEWRCEPGVHCTGDPVLLRTVLDNLLANAWKFSAQQERPCVEFGIQMVDGERTFFVRDNGVGFNPAYTGKLFQPFQRLHGAEFEGTGIGLATVRGIVQRHGGRVGASATPGLGATFYFTLGCSYEE